MLVAVATVIGLLIGGVVGALVIRTIGASRFDKALRTRQQLLLDAEREADAMRRETRIEAREAAVKLRAGIEEEIERKVVEIARREQGLDDREEASKQLHADLKEAKAEQLRRLERLAGMTTAEAKQHLLERSEDLIRHELARQVRQMEEEARTEAKRRARNLVADALQRVAASHAAETTVTLVELPSDDMKGRIIGREGRNIRALEHLTGVDFIID